MAHTIDRFHRISAVMEMTGLKRSTLYDHIKKGLFPTPVKLGPRASGWRESDIAKWQAERPSAVA
ncbi:MAG: AlpA family transcriptional regulator [Boseongicola sp. SB0662_bin_57]|nr:AlpA family transcriptional regulator [Boseongicola sp. SB0662_bin_57]